MATKYWEFWGVRRTREKPVAIESNVNRIDKVKLSRAQRNSIPTFAQKIVVQDAEEKEELLWRV
jgi:hypothetical protein